MRSYPKNASLKNEVSREENMICQKCKKPIPGEQIRAIKEYALPEKCIKFRNAGQSGVVK